MFWEKPWKTEALVRLCASIGICAVLVGLTGDLVIRFLSEPGLRNPLLFAGCVGGSLTCLAGALWILRRPLRYETFVRTFLILLFFVYGGVLLSWFTLKAWESAPEGLSSGRIVVAVLSFQLPAILLAWRFVREHELTVPAAFGFRIMPGRAIVFGVLFALAFIPVGLILQTISVFAMETLHLPAEEQSAIRVLRTTADWSRRALLGILAVFLAPIAEEVLFRGILYPFLKQRGYPRLAWLGTAVLFAIIHFNVATFLALTALALGLVWLYERTSNLLAPIAAHSAFNALNFALLYGLPWLLDRWDIPLPQDAFI